MSAESLAFILEDLRTMLNGKIPTNTGLSKLTSVSCSCMILSSLSHHASGVRDSLLLPLLGVKFSLQLITPFDTSIICLIRNKMNEDSMGMYLRPSLGSGKREVNSLRKLSGRNTTEVVVL